MAINSQCSMVVNEGGDQAFVKAGNEDVVLLSTRELCSFGSGAWNDEREATETMESSARWLSCTMTFETLVILDRKRLLSHLLDLECVEKAVPLKKVLQMLEDKGEAGTWIQSLKCSSIHLSNNPAWSFFQFCRSEWASATMLWIWRQTQSLTTRLWCLCWTKRNKSRQRRKQKNRTLRKKQLACTYRIVLYGIFNW